MAKPCWVPTHTVELAGDALAKEADPALDDFGYDLTAGSVTEKTDTTAVGSITVDVQGTDDISPAGQRNPGGAGAALRP